MRALDELLRIMADLRDPESGCPWDIRQDFDSIKPYTIEEAYEVADAIERKDMDELRSELGDLLFQVVFHAQMASEQGLFDFRDVVETVNEKLVRRHPHVFADEQVQSHEHLAERWEQHKQAERDSKQDAADEVQGALSGVASSLPALQWSQKLQKRAMRTGFDWPDIEPVFDKLNEEVAELREEIAGKSEWDDNHERIQDEYGDVLFVCANLGLHLKVNAEQAMRQANRKFIERFSLMEQLARQDGVVFEELGLEQMEEYWQKAKVKISENDN